MQNITIQLNACSRPHEQLKKQEPRGHASGRTHWMTRAAIQAKVSHGMARRAAEQAMALEPRDNATLEATATR